MKLQFVNFFLASLLLPFSRIPDILLCTLFSYILILLSCPNLRDEFPHPYTATGITVLFDLATLTTLYYVFVAYFKTTIQAFICL